MVDFQMPELMTIVDGPPGVLHIVTKGGQGLQQLIELLNSWQEVKEAREMPVVTIGKAIIVYLYQANDTETVRERINDLFQAQT
jgi:hypothetical protein